MGSNLRLAVIGAGRMGAIHVRTLGQADGIELVAVVDNRTEVAQRVGAETSVPALDSLARLHDLYEPEAWLVATPTPTHPPLVAQALVAGIHVLCEKPLALDAQVGADLGTRAAAAGRVLQVGFWRRFAPPWREAKKLIADGAIGRPLYVRLSQWDANPPPPDFCDPAVSGGLAIDCGVHEFDLAEWLTDLPVRRVLAQYLPVVERGVGEAGDVDNLVALLDLADGVTATVDLSRNGRYGDDVRTEVLGSEGAIFIETLPTARARVATRAGFEVVTGSEADDAMASGLVGQALAFKARVESGGPGNGLADIPGAEASNRAVAIGRAVQTAAQSGVWVDV